MNAGEQAVMESNAKPDPFRAMQRQEHIAYIHKSNNLIRRICSIDNRDSPVTLNRFVQQLKLVRILISIHGLNHQSHAFIPIRKRIPESLDAT